MERGRTSSDPRWNGALAMPGSSGAWRWDGRSWQTGGTMSSDDVSHYDLTDRDERARQVLMQVRFWGTRGSIPTPGRSTEKFGGNTTCLEMRYGSSVLVFDAGSGIRNLGRAWVDSANQYPTDATLLFTHFHWDHIQGFPFFTPAYLPNNRFTVYSDMKLHGDALEQLAGQMQGAYFPVPIKAMRSRMEFKSVEPKFSIGPFDITTFHLPHPGGCIGYRVVAGGTTVVFATDCELESIRGGEGNPPYDAPNGGWADDVVEFLSGADLLIIDSQYTDKAYGDCKGGATTGCRPCWPWWGWLARRWWRCSITIRETRMSTSRGWRSCSTHGPNTTVVWGSRRARG